MTIVSRRLRGAPAKPGQQCLNLGRGFCRTEQESLNLIAAFGTQPVELADGFHALRRRRDVQAAAKAGNRSHNRYAIGTLAMSLMKERSILILSNGKLLR